MRNVPKHIFDMQKTHFLPVANQSAWQPLELLTVAHIIYDTLYVITKVNNAANFIVEFIVASRGFPFIQLIPSANERIIIGSLLLRGV